MDAWRQVPDDPDVRYWKKCMPQGTIHAKLKRNGKQEIEPWKTKGER
jgi:hypothetical protein